mgnify:FL=1
MKKSLSILLCLALLAIGFLGLYLQSKPALADDLLRLHIIANSDDPYDQQVKLAIRDKLLKYYSDKLSDADTRKQAVAVIAATLPEAEAYCNEQLKGLADYSACMQLGESDFPLREYGALTVPAGEYLALRVILGEGQGKNWWCVLFPPLCFIEGTAEWETATVAVGEQTGQTVEVRSKLAELWK